VNPLIVIPVRLASQRLPEKPFAKLGDAYLIDHVIEGALQACIAPVVVAVDSERLVKHIQRFPIKIILTPSALASGSDRIAHALNLYDPEKHFDLIINLQGDLAVFPPQKLSALNNSFPAFDIVTLAVPLTSQDYGNPHAVKAVLERVPPSPSQSFISRPLTLQDQANVDCPTPSPIKALNFTRQLSTTQKNIAAFHHIGVYAYKRRALEHFVSLKPTQREKTEKLEQLRALESGLSIGVIPLSQESRDDTWISVDTPQDLHKAHTFLQQAKSA